jgi:hypothetical protein
MQKQKPIVAAECDCFEQHLKFNKRYGNSVFVQNHALPCVQPCRVGGETRDLCVIAEDARPPLNGGKGNWTLNLEIENTKAVRFFQRLDNYILQCAIEGNWFDKTKDELVDMYKPIWREREDRPRGVLTTKFSATEPPDCFVARPVDDAKRMRVWKSRQECTRLLNRMTRVQVILCLGDRVWYMPDKAMFGVSLKIREILIASGEASSTKPVADLFQL